MSLLPKVIPTNPARLNPQPQQPAHELSKSDRGISNSQLGIARF
jgi:hypothetical protein